MYGLVYNSWCLICFPLDASLAVARFVSSRCWYGIVSRRDVPRFLWKIFCRKCSVCSLFSGIVIQFWLCRICFKLRVMLLAIEMKRTDENGNTRMFVDVIPCDYCIILPGSRAFIVCMSCEDANRFVWMNFYIDQLSFFLIELSIIVRPAIL
jgi:hypothetical protein